MPMRLRPRFSPRTLLVAVSLAALACWYFVNGSAFHENTIIVYFKSGAVPNGQLVFPMWKMTAYLSRHYFPSNRSRVHLAILEHGEPFASAPNQRAKWIEHHFWRSGVNGKVYIRYPNTYKLFPEYYERQSAWIPRDKNYPANTPIIDVTGKGETSLENSENYKSMNITCDELDRFAADESVSDWPIASLEKWLQVHRKYGH
jgi:hypothetical protein